MSSKFSISVVIPAFNAEKFITRAINSVMAQTYLPVEIIVVDDGSKDQTYELVNCLFPSVSLYKQENKGASMARNLGIKMSKGEWITFLDADDEFCPTILESYKNLLVNSSLMWCSAPYFIQRHSNVRMIKYRGNQLERHKIRNIFLAYKDFNAKVYSELISTCSVIIKKRIFTEVGLFNENLVRGEDIDMWFRIALKYPEIGYVDNIAYTYLKTNLNSITSIKRNSESLLNNVRTINHTWSQLYLQEKIKEKEASHVLNNWCFRLFKSIIKSGQFGVYSKLSVEVKANLYWRNQIFIVSFRFLEKIKV